MKILFLYLNILLLLISCVNSSKEKLDGEDVEENVNIYSKELKNYLPVMQEIIVSEKGLIRGLKFGLTEEEVRGIERAKFTQSDVENQFLLTESMLSKDVNLDVEYHFVENKLNKLLLVIYTTGYDQQGEVYKGLQEYFNHKFHKKEKASSWYINNLKLTIKKVGNAQEADIELIFEQLDI